MDLGNRVNEDSGGRLIWEESMDQSSPGTDSDHGEDHRVVVNGRVLIGIQTSLWGI